MFHLEMVDAENRKIRFPLAEGVVSVGRNKDNDIVLLDQSVSRSHCLFYVRGDEVEIEDLGSVNGVVVRGERVSRRTPVSADDELLIGETRLHLRRTSPLEHKSTTMIVDLKKDE
jgi:S-DNA-T family DNA segregation ATPase FtsK/SpoIIIE